MTVNISGSAALSPIARVVLVSDAIAQLASLHPAKRSSFLGAPPFDSRMVFLGAKGGRSHHGSFADRRVGGPPRVEEPGRPGPDGEPDPRARPQHRHGAADELSHR